MVSKLNFNIIDTHDFKTLGIVDTSWYNPDITVETPTIEILVPGYSVAASPYFMFQALNIYNSNGLGITKASCEEDLVTLPDGLYKVRYSICPNDELYIERFFLRIDKLQCQYTQAFLNLDLKCDTPTSAEKRMKLDEVEFWMKGAISASNNQNAKDAHDFYQKADKLLTQYLSNNGLCGC